MTNYWIIRQDHLYQVRVNVHKKKLKKIKNIFDIMIIMMYINRRN